MTDGAYDIITVGGGLAGAALAKVMAEQGVRVLVLERETSFKERLRGETLMPWGGAEARTLGLYDDLKSAVGHEVRWLDTYLGPVHFPLRDLVATTPSQTPFLSFHHPRMQEHLLNAAVSAGAEVQQGVHVVDVRPGERPTVVVRDTRTGRGATGSLEEITARLVVAADGRHSMAQKWTGVAVEREPERMRISGVIFEGIPIQETTGFAVFNPEIGEGFYLTPQRDGQVRGWLMYPPHLDLQLHGAEAVSRFIAEAIRIGTPQPLLAQAHAVTRVITYCGGYPRVVHPYKGGVVFIGDCAACDDPTFGEGMALALRDVRVLRDHLLATQDWDVAAHAYAEEHDKYFETVRILGNWYWNLFLETGPEADARRARALALIAQDDTRMFDLFGLGPEVPATEATRRRFFGEDAA